MAFPDDVLDLHLDLWYDDQWNEHTSDVRGMGAEDGEVEIKRGRPNESGRVRPTSMKFAVNDVDKEFSVLHPNSALYGKVGQNTPVRAYIGTLFPTDTNFDLTDTTSQVAPSVVSPTDDALLLCAWGMPDNGAYTKPASMTQINDFEDSEVGSLGRFLIAREAITSVGATGTRTATSANAEDYVSASVLLSGSPTYEDFSPVVNMYSISADAGDWLILFAYFGWDDADEAEPPSRPSDYNEGIWTLIADTGLINPVDVDADNIQLKVWAKRVTTTGTQTGELAIIPGQITLGTIVRVSGVTNDFSSRAHTEISSMQPRRAGSGNAKWSVIESRGILSRLDSNNRGKSLRSALYREVTSDTNAPFLVAYWPCEDGRNSTSIAPGIEGVEPMRLFAAEGTTFADYDGFSGSDPIATVATNSARAPIPSYSGDFFYRGLLAIPDAGFIDGAQMLSFRCTGGDVEEVELEYSTGGNWLLRLFDEDEVLIDETSTFLVDLDGSQILASIELVQDGSDLDWILFKREVNLDGTIGDSLLASGTFTGVSLGTVREIRVGGTTTVGMSFGHQMVGNSQSLIFNITDALVGWNTETATRRFIRLCQEEGIDHAVIGDPDESTPMGPQLSGRLIDLLQECEASEHGILFEPKEFFGLGFRTLRSMYNQSAILTLDGSDGEIAQPWAPLPDSYLIRNDVEVKRIGGSSARAVQDSGPLNVNDPTDDPEGVGIYEFDADLSLAVDGQNEHHAGWILNKGTKKEPRFPAIKINLARDPELIDDAASLDIGDRVVVENPPDDVAPDDVSQLAFGFAERLSQFRREIDINTEPESPYHIAELEHADYSFIGADPAWEFELAGSYTSGTDTTIGVTFNSVISSTEFDFDNADPPFDVMVGGVRARVTAVSLGLPTLLTVNQVPVNGVIKTVPTGTPVEIFPRNYIGL